MVFGAILILFGLNGIFKFLPIPEKEGFAFDFLHTLAQARYLMPTIALIMITSGSLLVYNKWIALSLLLLLPISFNMFAFHLLHDWQGLIAASMIFLINGLLLIPFFNKFKLIIN